MAIYSFENKTFQKISETNFNSEGILERQHLQTALKTQIDIVAPNCLVISEEFSEWSESQCRIDLLAIDREANLVVIELKPYRYRRVYGAAGVTLCGNGFYTHIR